MFDLIGVLLLFYVLYALSTGQVFAKSGIWGKTVSRSESPGNYWAVIVIYSGLVLALIFLF